MQGEEIKMMIGMKEDIASIKTTLNTMANTNTVALEALQSARAAHHRIDEMNSEIKESRSGQRWMVGTSLTVFALFMTALGLLWKAVAG